MSASTGIIEHVVLFKVNDGADQSKVDTWLTGLNSLAAIDHVLHLTAGPLRRTHSSLFTFTHMLHCRYRSKSALDAYSAHPDHVRVVRDLGLPICQDLMAVDWAAAGVDSAAALTPGSAIKVGLLKLKENYVGDEVREEVLKVVEKMRDGFARPPEQFTCGENFSPGRARGYCIGWMAVFGGGDEVVLANSDFAEVREYLEDVVIVDYVIPARISASI